MSNFKLRTTFYSLTLVLAFFNQGLGIWLGIIDDFSPNQWIFGIVLAAVSLLTWIWTSVLLAYNNRPTSKHALTRASAHFYSFLPLVPIYFAVGIVILSQVHYNCNPNLNQFFSDGLADGWCGSGATAGALSLVQSIIAALAIWSILRPMGLRTNVAFADSGAMNQEPIHSLAQPSSLDSVLNEIRMLEMIGSRLDNLYTHRDELIRRSTQ